MFEKISSKDIQSNSTRWNFSKPRPKDKTTDNSRESVMLKRESAAVLGDSRLKKSVSRLRLRSENIRKPELNYDERERLRIFLSRTKKSRDQLMNNHPENRLKESESVDIKVYINDLNYKVVTLQSSHSKSDLCQLAIQAFKLNPAYNYTLSLWRNFKQNLEIKESGESSPFKLYFNVVHNDPTSIFHIHRTKQSKVTQQSKPPQLGPNMEDKVPTEASGPIFQSPKRKTPRVKSIGFNLNSTSKQSPTTISKIKAIYITQSLAEKPKEAKPSQGVKVPLKQTNTMKSGNWKQIMMSRGDLNNTAPN